MIQSDETNRAQCPTRPLCVFRRSKTEYHEGSGTLRFAAIANYHVADRLGLTSMSRTVVLWILIAVVLVFVFGGSAFVELIVDYHWFEAIGFPQVFTTVVWAKIYIGAVGIAVAFLILFANLAYAARQVGDLRRFMTPQMLSTGLGNLVNKHSLAAIAATVSLVLAVLTGIAPAANWEHVLLFLNAVPFGDSDPIFGRDTSFYVFTLPFYATVLAFFWSTVVVAAIGSGAIYYLNVQAELARKSTGDSSLLAVIPASQRMHLALLGAFMLLLWSVSLYFDRFELMHQSSGLFTGPGYADVNGTLPVLAVQAVTALLAAVALVVVVAKGRWRMLLALAGVVGVVWLGGGLYAPVLQRLVVAPNELERERTYLDHHIKGTNRAYALDRVVERRLDEEDEITMADIENNRATVNNVRLWDHAPLLDTFAQIQEIRTYYDFVSVDNDRYRLNGELRQTMLSPREMNNESLPSRTWVNERLTFTHGYGLTVGPVNRVNEQGLPVLYVQDLPPRSTAPEFEVSRPEIYFGEVTTDYVFVNTRQQEFNYPEGDQNIFSTYDGEGGIALESLWRRLLISAFTLDLKMLLSDDFTADTRVLIYRHVAERVRKVAPFFRFDADPYMVIDEGRLFWIFDGYTVSDRFPYSEHFPRVGNYLRNPVKAVIDAYHGNIAFYMVDAEEPIARAWSAVFPGMIRPLDDLAPSLRAHLRHPVGFFNVQAEIYATYHMHDVNTFYNKEDQWSVPEVDDARMEPYYTVMRLPQESEAEFILMLPFTPRLKDNLSAWMVARNDGDLLSQLVVYVFPKQRLIYGPKQMVGRINQDPIVSQQITLWDRAGSSVIRGTLLVIPIEQSLLYIQPLYLRAVDGRIPELKRVIVGYGNDIAMGVDLEDALKRIFAGMPGSRPDVLGRTAIPLPAVGALPVPDPDTPPASPAARAQRHYDALRDAAAAGDWTRFGQELDALGESLRTLEE